MADLSREQVEAYRGAVTRGDVMVDREHLTTLLDAYEATRPRPASEPPNFVRGQVLVRHAGDPGCYAPAWYESLASDEQRWMWENGDWIDVVEILDWIPLPTVPR